jgi:hypothetical protein
MTESLTIAERVSGRRLPLSERPKRVSHERLSTKHLDDATRAVVALLDGGFTVSGEGNPVRDDLSIDAKEIEQMCIRLLDTSETV